MAKGSQVTRFSATPDNDAESLRSLNERSLVRVDSHGPVFSVASVLAPGLDPRWRRETDRSRIVGR